MACAVSVLDSGSNNLGRVHSVVFLGKTLFTLIASLSQPRCINGYWLFTAGVTPRWTSIPSRGK